MDGEGGAFTFTVLLQNGSTGIRNFTLNDSGTPSDTTDDVITNANGEATVVMYVMRDSSSSVVLKVPKGANLTITETDTGSNSYATTWELNNNGTQTSSVTTGQINVTEDLTITFTNGQVTIAPTGIRSNMTAYQWLLVLGFGIFVITALSKRRRKSEEDEADEA